MLKLNYFLADIFILSAEKQPIKLSWRKIEWLQVADAHEGAGLGNRALTKFISPQVGTSVAFYFSGHPNFAANQSVTVMEIITFESKAYKELDNKITAIADYIFNHMETARQSEEDMWVDSYEVCTFLKISEKTLQRLRVSSLYGSIQSIKTRS